MRKVLIMTVGFVAVFVAAVLLGMHFDPLCGEESLFEETSPDGHYVATSMIRNCGATTEYVSHLNLRRSGTALRHDFLGGTVSDGEIFSLKDYTAVRFCWLAPRRINIGYPQSERGIHKATDWRDVEITYGRECP